MLSINMACSITCVSHVINTVITALLQCQQYILIVVLQCTAIICQSINPDCFWKIVKFYPVDAEIFDSSYRYLANYR